MVTLVIVESPGKVKKIQGFLGSDYKVVATRGHLLGLPSRGYGFDCREIASEFDVKYVPLVTKSKDIATMRTLARSASRVIVATDGDREGAAIGFHALLLLGIHWTKAQRAVFFEITKDAVTRAVMAPMAMETLLYEAQQARRLVDRVVGYLVSPAVRRHVIGGKSAGRCQSVALALVYDRDTAVTKCYQSSPMLHTTLHLGGVLNGAIAQVANQFADDATTTVRAWVSAAISNAGIVVSGTPETKKAIRHPPPAFTTSTLLQVAGSSLGFGPKVTMALLQKLYTAGHITYHRTDSVALAHSFVKDAGQVVTEAYGEDMLSKRFYRRKSNSSNRSAQEAHEAIRPTKAGVSHIRSTMGAKLYALIRRRAIATQCRPEISETVSVCLMAPANPTLKHATLTVRRMVDPGFRLVSSSSSKKTRHEVQPLFDAVAALRPNSRVLVERVVSSEKLPVISRRRFTESSLVAELERVGIGRPSTYASIVRTVRERNYATICDSSGAPIELSTFTLTTSPDATIERSIRVEHIGAYKRRLVPTKSGRDIVTYLRTNFPEVVDIAFTANVENALDNIANGSMAWRDEVRRVWSAIEPRAKAERKRERPISTAMSSSSNPSAIGKDPATGQSIYVYEGRYGPVVRVGEGKQSRKEPSCKFANIPKGTSLDQVDLKTALFLLSLPLNLAKEANEPAVLLKHGRFGFYVERYDNGPKSKPTTRTVAGGLRTARAISLEQALSLLSKPNTFSGRRRKHRCRRKRKLK